MYIDIRSRDRFLNGHIGGAININYIELLSDPGRFLNKDDTYYIYCDNGFKSMYVVNKLVKLGYNCVNIDGGYNNYLKNIV